VRAAGSPAEAVRGADTVVVATSSRTPVLRGEWLSDGTHVNAVGACRPDWRELDDDLVRGARLYVESREAATRESGDVMAGTVVAELGEVVAGTAPGRRTDDEVTLFKSVGVAAEDIATAVLVYDLATDKPR
jgi:thiomorpholine-carboxylate dehydrogenase